MSDGAEPVTYDTDEVKAGRIESEVHNLAAEHAADTDGQMRIVGPAEEIIIHLPDTDDHLFGLEAKAHAVGFFNQLQEERKNLGLSAYATGAPETTDERKAIERAALDYDMA